MVYCTCKELNLENCKRRELRNSNLSSGCMWLPDVIVVLYLPGMTFFTG